MNQKISVVIPTYNYGRFIDKAIESVLGQTYSVAELIVVDDGSTDETAEAVARFGDAVQYIVQNNGGVGAARNTGAASSTGDYIAFLDADDIWLPTKIEQQIAKFNEDAAIGLVHCGMREFDSKTGDTLCLNVQGEEGWVAEDLLLFEKPVICGPGSTSLISRAAWDNVGGYDTDRYLHPSEDWEFSLRLARKYKIGFIPEPLVEYRNHGVNAHLDPQRVERSTRTAWAKAFSSKDETSLRLKRRSYGNMHKVLAGSYLYSGQYSGFLRNIIKSLWFRPAYLGYYLSLLANRQMKR